MLPAQKQESHQPTTMTTNSTAAFENNGTNSIPTATAAAAAAAVLGHRRRASNIEGRSKKQKYAQEYHPYHSASSGQVSRHRKHRSQPVNLLQDPNLLINSTGLSYTTSTTPAVLGGNYANFLQENRIPGGNLQSSARQRSMSEVAAQQGFLQDVTSGVTNAQDLSNPQLNRPMTPRGLTGMNFMPVTPGSPFVGLLPQQSSAFSHQVSQQALNNQFLLSPQSTRKQKRAFPPLATPIRAIPPPANLVEELQGTGHMRRHSLDTTPVRNVDSYFTIKSSGLPSPPNSAPLITTNSFDMAPMPNPSTSGISHITVPEDGSFDDDDDDDDTSYFSPSGSSSHSPTSPSSPHMQSIDSVLSSEKLQQALQSARHGIVDSTDSAQSSRDNLEGDIDEETRVPGGFVKASGISNDEISAYISGPEPSDNKWVCLYPDCQKRFGRKENIKSHVQTHLGDRQFRCEVCKKCFVRQHDLKRHAKIHTGIKPYPCKCGNSFARHDALTRHRQRGMCIGAFEGIVKKIVKRGRPKKIKVEGEPETPKKRRRNKKRVREGEGGSSSGSGTSVSSGSSIGASSPSAYDDNEIWENPTSPILRLLEPVPEVSSNIPSTTGKRKRGASPDSDEDVRGGVKRGRLDEVPLNTFSQFVPSDFGLQPTSPILSVPSSPGDLLNEISGSDAKKDNSLGFCDPLLSSFDEDTSFTPEGSPELAVINRRYVSAFNTPEWDPVKDVKDVDLREILGLPELDPSTGVAVDPVIPAWGSGKDIGNDMGLSGLGTLNSGFDLGLADEGFDFIKPELLQESDVLDLQLWSNLQGEY
ncbi:hypothetical protein ABW19_dt0203525 [Dactylella cylindrospora]|nr:hypothetical protein ABW19_dt0203525 [Dactylella cylindrospora]